MDYDYVSEEVCASLWDCSSLVVYISVCCLTPNEVEGYVLLGNQSCYMQEAMVCVAQQCGERGVREQAENSNMKNSFWIVVEGKFELGIMGR